ncbi:hypothetical protein C8N36_10910 [Pelagimonas varians]|uniref:Uncharacterized protein n=1 Tax=Pelagimonas varians TaxID=696760 RepID=A0A238KMA9_9RHOB|nr:hypothetical protein C8N36_10910 [Pelagimonas varians]SMX43820.1 hypothetical protein PEV8663_02758 [Pelagimonas varians]
METSGPFSVSRAGHALLDCGFVCCWNALSGQIAPIPLDEVKKDFPFALADSRLRLLHYHYRPHCSFRLSHSILH